MEDRADYAQYQRVEKLLSEDLVWQGTMAVLLRQKGGNGWGVARVLNEDPQKVGVALDVLVRHGLIGVQSGSGLDGYYFPTSLAYRFMPSFPVG
jgi:hypothetical protein